MSTTERLGDHAQQVADSAKEQTRELAHHASDHALDLVGRAAEELRGQGDEQGRRMAGSLRAVTDDLRGMSQHSTGATPVADVMCGLADAGDRMADRLEREGLAGVAREIADYGRRSPGRFLLISAAAGVLAGRLLRNVDTTAIKDSIGAAGDGDSPGGQGPGAVRDRTSAGGNGAPGGPGDIASPGSDLPPVELPGDVAVPSGAPVTGGVGGTTGLSGASVPDDGGLR